MSGKEYKEYKMFINGLPIDMDGPNGEIWSNDSRYIVSYIVENIRNIRNVPTALLESVITPSAWDWITHHSPKLFEPDAAVSPWMWITMARMAMKHNTD